MTASTLFSSTGRRLEQDSKRRFLLGQLPFQGSAFLWVRFGAELPFKVLYICPVDFHCHRMPSSSNITDGIHEIAAGAK
jgi:hypothetical protein